MRVAAIMVGMLVSLVFAKKLAGEETNRQKEMRFDDQHVTNGLSESRSPSNLLLQPLGSELMWLDKGASRGEGFDCCSLASLSRSGYDRLCRKKDSAMESAVWSRESAIIC